MKIIEIMEREVTAAMQRVGATTVHELVPEMVSVLHCFMFAISLNFFLRSNKLVGSR